MKIWYLIKREEQEFCIAYGNNAQDALNKLAASRTYYDIDTDLSHWDYEEFTPDKYDGCIYFY